MVTIRPSGLQDLDVIYRLNDAFIHPNQSKDCLQSVLSRGKAWVAEDTEVIGAIVGKIKYDVPYVHSIAVDSRRRGQGIATLLFAAFEKEFSNYPKLNNENYWLQVNINNPAQKLYFDLGYRAGGIDTNFYGEREHAICMYKGPQP